jgi:hypothetical protein
MATPSHTPLTSAPLPPTAPTFAPHPQPHPHQFHPRYPLFPPATIHSEAHMSSPFPYAKANPSLQSLDSGAAPTPTPTRHSCHLQPDTHPIPSLTLAQVCFQKSTHPHSVTPRTIPILALAPTSFSRRHLYAPIHIPEPSPSPTNVGDNDW